MFREITTVSASTYQITLPENLRGKKIEIIAFEIESVEEMQSVLIDSFEQRTENFRINTKGFKFDRNEANEYD
jgi:hypothetical protein